MLELYLITSLNVYVIVSQLLVCLAYIMCYIFAFIYPNVMNAASLVF